MTAGPGNDYEIKVETMDGEYVDTSNDTFSITNPSVTVVTPNGGQEWLLGKTYNIIWSAQGVTTPLFISLWKDGVNIDTLATRLNPGDGSYAWKVGETFNGRTVPPGTGYKIKIRVEKTPYFDFSDDPFTIVDPSIAITSPNGDDVWNGGENRAITWTASGIPGDLKLTLWRGDSQMGVIASGLTPSSGSYLWTVGNYVGGSAPAGLDYRVKIEEEDGGVIYDFSDSPFTIYRPSTITVQSPNGDEQLGLNGTKNISWSSANVIHTQKLTLWQNGVLIGVIGDNIDPSKKYYTWTVGTYIGGSVPPGTGFKIKVEENLTSTSDMSDASFTIN